ncbi:MAG: DMT family transporter [Thermoplasmata archaeon]
MPQRDLRHGVYLTLLASLIWGTSFPGAEWGLRYVGNDVLFLWLRFLVASVVTLSVVLLVGKFSFSVMKEPVIWLIGGFNAAGFILQYVGLVYTTASKTALLVDINVVAVAIVSYFAFRERLSRPQLLGVVVGSLGVVLVTSDKGLSFSSSELLGDILAYLAGWSWAFFIVLSKKTLARRTAVEISSGAIASCTLFLAPVVAYLALTDNADLTVGLNGWLAAVYLGVFCTSVATLLWAMGLEGVSATASATIMLVEVVTALVIAFALLDESLRLTAAVGAACVLAAIYLVSASEPAETAKVKPI